MHETLKESECRGRTNDLDMWGGMKEWLQWVKNKECVVGGEDETERHEERKGGMTTKGMGGAGIGRGIM